MSRTRVQEPPKDRRVAAAANEDFNAVVSAARDVEHPKSGWDPYEVWLIRVKVPAQLKKARARLSESAQ